MKRYFLMKERDDGISPGLFTFLLEIGSNEEESKCVSGYWEIIDETYRKMNNSIMLPNMSEFGQLQLERDCGVYHLTVSIFSTFSFAINFDKKAVEESVDYQIIEVPDISSGLLLLEFETGIWNMSIVEKVII